MWSRHALNITRISCPANQSSIRKIQSTVGGSYIQNPGSEPLRYDTLGNYIAKTVDSYPNRVAVKSVYENKTITYEQLLEQADALGCSLRAQGLQKGDRLGIWSHNNIAWIVALVAAARAGLISVLINPVYEKDELSFCLKKTEIKSLLVGDNLSKKNYYESLAQLIPQIRNSKTGSWKSEEFPNLTSIISNGKTNSPGTISYDSLINNKGSQISQYGSDLTSKDGSIIHFTSGTTGYPKAALDSHLGAVNNSYFSGKRCQFHESHHNICVQVPMFHALGSIVTILGGLMHGASLILASAMYNVDANINALFAEKCTAVIGTPTMFVDMLSKVKTMGDVPSKVRLALAAGAPCSPTLIKDMQKYLKADVQALYGMTESTAANFQSTPEDSVDVVANTVGYIHDHVEAKVVDDNGDMVPFGTPGELVVRGYNSMICYWNEPEKTRQVYSEDGWLKTGDKFILNPDGYGRIVGRLKDIIVRGGENVAPKEVEDLLNTHPDIVESQIVGVPDERLGEEICAVLRLRHGASITQDDIKSHCSGHIAKFKIPRVLRIIEEFPKTESGKIQKFKLLELIKSGKL